jgi:hypothetical protein
MNESDRNRLESFFDLLADAVADRIAARTPPPHAKPSTPPTPLEPTDVAEGGERFASSPIAMGDWTRIERSGRRGDEGLPPIDLPPSVEYQGVPPAPESSLPESDGPRAQPDEPAAFAPTNDSPADVPPPRASHAAAFLARLAIGVILVVVLINIPLNAQGIALARSVPNTTALVIRDGLLIKEANSPDVWVYRDGEIHWITSLDAFEQYGYRWQNVHVVDSAFLNSFRRGKPIYVLLKCPTSPHVYRLEDGRKRWIVDIPTFEAEGYAWKDIKMVACSYLRSLPDGESVPPGRGAPPPPLP